MTFRQYVQLDYDGRFYPQADKPIHDIAIEYGGIEESSGFGFGHRDIEYSFASPISANIFLDKLKELPIEVNASGPFEEDDKDEDEV